MYAQTKTQRASLALLFMAAEKAVKVRNQVDDILEDCGAAVVDDDDPRVVLTRLGNKFSSPVFEPLKNSPTIDINYEEVIAMDDLGGLDLEHKEVIRQRVLKLSIDNQGRAKDSNHKISKRFCRLYKHLSR